jgi:hypothetical protein
MKKLDKYLFMKIDRHQQILISSFYAMPIEVCYSMLHIVQLFFITTSIDFKFFHIFPHFYWTCIVILINLGCTPSIWLSNLKVTCMEAILLSLFYSLWHVHSHD